MANRPFTRINLRDKLAVKCVIKYQQLQHLRTENVATLM